MISAKESFRIDYYKTMEHGRLKGIIEHLPTRQKKSFKGLGIKLIAPFMEPFLPEQVSMVRLVPGSLPGSVPEQGKAKTMAAPPMEVKIAMAQMQVPVTLTGRNKVIQLMMAGSASAIN